MKEVEMKKISLVLVFMFIGMAFSQPPNGSKSLIHTQSARTFESGRLEVHSSMNFFTRASDFIGSGAKPADFKAVNYWLVSGNMALTYGIMDHLDFTVAPRIYQDTHYSNEYNLPGDVFLTFKGGSFAFAGRRMYGALMTTIRLGTGQVHNYPFTEYASGATEYAFTGALSYFMDPYLPDRSFNAHLNVGWWNHNEASHMLFPETKNSKGVVTIPERDATKNSTELQYALGLVYPTEMFDYRLELYGTNFISQPDEWVYSRENYTYLTPSIRYKALSWISMDFGIDIRISSDKNTTAGVPDKTSENLDLPNYSAWKVQMGLNIKLLPFTSNRKTAAEVERDQFNQRVKFFQKIVQDRQRSEQVEEQLDQLKEERKQAEKELEELKQIMDEQNN